MGGEELKWHQLKHNQLMSSHGPHFSPHSTAKTNEKVQISGRMASIGISDVATASEKTRLKKLMKITIIMIMNKSQETTVFHGRQKLTSAKKTKARKVMVDFKYTGKSS